MLARGALPRPRAVSFLLAGARIDRAVIDLVLALSFVATAVLAAHFCARYHHNFWDDAYISLRYVKNLAHGEGLVFNPGERVEGYSNFLWIVFLTPSYRLA